MRRIKSYHQGEKRRNQTGPFYSLKLRFTHFLISHNYPHIPNKTRVDLDAYPFKLSNLPLQTSLSSPVIIENIPDLPCQSISHQRFRKKFYTFFENSAVYDHI